MEFFRGVNVNWLGYKWYFLAFSMIFSVAGIAKMSWNWSHIGTPVPLSVDFRGGTEVQVQFANRPDINAIRQAMEAAGIKDARIQNFDVPSLNEVVISLPEQTNETSLDTGRQQIVDALHAHYNNSFNDTGIKVDVVGPTVGHQLESQATAGGSLVHARHAGLSLVPFPVDLRRGRSSGLLPRHAHHRGRLRSYRQGDLAHRHRRHSHPGRLLDERHHRGLRSIRENLRISRQEPLPDLVNRSINQTLSRTVLTSGLTFLTVLSLFIFGGEVLNGFSFALVVGILIGTYSSIAVAAPMLVAWQQWRAGKGKGASLPAARRAK